MLHSPRPFYGGQGERLRHGLFPALRLKIDILNDALLPYSIRDTQRIPDYNSQGHGGLLRSEDASFPLRVEWGLYGLEQVEGAVQRRAYFCDMLARNSDLEHVTAMDGALAWSNSTSTYFLRSVLVRLHHTPYRSGDFLPSENTKP